MKVPPFHADKTMWIVSFGGLVALSPVLGEKWQAKLPAPQRNQAALPDVRAISSGKFLSRYSLSRFFALFNKWKRFV